MTMTKAELLQRIAVAVTVGPLEEAAARVMALMAEQPLSCAIAAGRVMGLSEEMINNSWRMLRAMAGMSLGDEITDEELR